MKSTAYVVLGLFLCWLVGFLSRRLLRRLPRREAGARFPEGYYFAGFSDHAKNVMHVADLEAHRLGHEYVGTEHFLLALLQEDGSVALEVLQNSGLDLDELRMEVERRAMRGPPMATVKQLFFTTGPKTVLDRSREEAANLAHNYIGTEHLLLGLIKERDGIAADVLRKGGVHLGNAREAILEVLGKMDGLPPPDTNWARSRDDPEVGRLD